MSTLAAAQSAPALNRYGQLELDYDVDIRTLFSWMKPWPRPCFNEQLLLELQKSERLLEAQRGYTNQRGTQQRVEYVVFGSRTPGVFNLGGDLNLFLKAIMKQDRETLSRYAHLCVDNVYRRSRGFDADITTIALVQGKALGGGFESALACDNIIAERSASFCLPEVLFNMFPGMGALSFLSRRIGLHKAEEIISSGEVFTARDMLDLGIVSEVVEDGLGLEAARAFIHHRQRRSKSHRALQLAKRLCQPVLKQELMSIVDVWVDAALKLDSRDLRMMSRLVRAQDRLMAVTPNEEQLVEQLYGQFGSFGA